MICFRAERFTWRRIWQNPGELLLPGIADMATRALLYRRPYEPSRILVKHGSQIYSVRLRRHRRARRYTLRIHPSDREAILTMPPRGTLIEAKDFAQRHGGWIAARLGRLPKAAPVLPRRVVALRGGAHRVVPRGGQRGAERAPQPRSVEPRGLMHVGRLAVVLLATDPRAALCAGLPRRP